MSINEILTVKEAEAIWGLSDSLRNTIRRGVFTEGTEVRKSCGTWLITKEAMERVYGEVKEDE